MGAFEDARRRGIKEERERVLRILKEWKDSVDLSTKDMVQGIDQVIVMMKEDPDERVREATKVLEGFYNPVRSIVAFAAPGALGSALALVETGATSLSEANDIVEKKKAGMQ